MLYILYYRIFCYPPPPPGQPKLSVTTDGLVLWYPISHKIYFWIKLPMQLFVVKKKVFHVCSCMNVHEHTWKLIKISGFVVNSQAMWPLSKIGTITFVAVFEGHEQIYLSLVGKGLIHVSGLKSMRVTIEQRFCVIFGTAKCSVWTSSKVANEFMSSTKTRFQSLYIAWCQQHRLSNY